MMLNPVTHRLSGQRNASNRACLGFQRYGLIDSRCIKRNQGLILYNLIQYSENIVYEQLAKNFQSGRDDKIEKKNYSMIYS